ncbi:hypothetical protein Cni_G07033 [Canna indica]|uniref:Uncharacterized protein n=1 Tax=Canna indica TaxID=4628 RepID=A0AAQ3JZM4_9LILI|nr:hypothetical protein Cni_G07033 [Canna indica]
MAGKKALLARGDSGDNFPPLPVSLPPRPKKPPDPGVLHSVQIESGKIIADARDSSPGRSKDSSSAAEARASTEGSLDKNKGRQSGVEELFTVDSKSLQGAPESQHLHIWCGAPNWILH